MVNDSFDFPTAGAIPRPLTSLIGRDQEIEEVGALLLREDVQLVTLTGPGGVGKTRLAIETASVISRCFADRVRFVTLAALIEPGAVLPAIASALGVLERGDISLEEQVAASMDDRRQLLVVDNFEHLMGAASDLASLLAACPSTKTLVTSRARLRLSGEWEYEVGPLPLPQHSEATSFLDAEHVASVQLFVQRASAAEFKFSLTENNLPAVEEICSRLGGLPLAIELAAARVKFLSLDAMIQQLQNSLAMLRGGGADTPTRHRTMSNAIQWSYELLSRVEQRVFRALAVFVGSFALEAAADVLLRVYGMENSDVELALESLVDHSLVRVIESAGSQPRFSMLEPLRDFAAEMLESNNERDAIRDAHAQYFLEFVERGSPYFGPGRVAKVQEVERETGNIYAALGWLIDQIRTEPALRLANALRFTLWLPRGRIREQQVWLHRVVDLPGVGLEAERAGAHIGIGFAEARSGNFDAALSAADEALKQARASQNPELITWALMVKGAPAWRSGNLVEAQTLLESAHAIAGETDDRFLLGWIHHNLALNTALSGDETLATSHFEKAQAIFQELGDPWELADLESNIAWHLEVKGQIARSAQLQRHALKEYWRLGDMWLMQFSFFVAGSDATTIGRCAQAVRIFGAMEQLRRQTGTTVPFGYEEEYGRYLNRARENLEEHEFADAWGAGESMTLEAVVAEADEVFAAWGETEATALSPAVPVHGLSPREIEVLRLVASGKSNRQIGEELFISVPTVKVHVRSIMGKLELDSRTALAAFAIRHQLD